MSAKQIFTAQAADGNSETFAGNGRASLKINGVFDGCSIQLQAKTNNSNDDYSTTGDAPITAAGVWNLEFSPNLNYRLVLSSAGASTSINAFVTQ
jgi:hypothetical protein